MMFSRVVRVKPFMRQIIFQMSTTTQRSGTQQAAATAAAGKMDIDRPSSDQFLLKMAHTPAESIVPNPPHTYSRSGVLHVERDELLSTAFKNLIEQRILSMPVVTKRNIRFFGFLDMVDVVNFITRNFANHQFTNFEEYAQLFKEVESWNQATVRDAMAYPNWKSSPYHPVPAGYSLFHAFEMMARSGFHRVCVTTPERQIATLLTQSMMIDYIRTNIEMIGDARQLRVSDMILSTSEPLVVKQSDRPLLAFQLMAEKGVTGLGVVDETGRLVDVVSARDTRGFAIDAASFWRLYGTVGDFKNALRINMADTPKDLYYVKDTDTLEWVITELSVHKIHRLFVIDDQGKPTKCIAQRDVLFNILHKRGEA